MSDRIPSAELPGWKHIAVSHLLCNSFIQMVINIIADKQIRDRCIGIFLFHICKFLDTAKQMGKCLIIQPVIGIHDFKICSCCSRKSCIHSRSMSSVFFMDHLYDIVIDLCIMIRNLPCPVCRPVVHNDHLHLISPFH